MANPASRSLILLAFGALCGILTALVELLEVPELPQGSVAMVNDKIISLQELNRVLAILESDKNSPLTDSDRRFVLDRLIDDELMVQQGKNLNLLRLDSNVRNSLIRAVSETVMAQSAPSVPDKPTLTNFYQSNLAFFSRPALLEVQQIFFRSKSDNEHNLQRAQRARSALLKHGDFAEVKSEFGDPLTIDIPATLLTPVKLKDYIGSSLVDVASRLDVGEISQPVRTAKGVHLLILRERQDAGAPTFDSISELVLKEYQRRSYETTMTEYLSWLRDEADIVIKESP